jgi:hypothetical protein
MENVMNIYFYTIDDDNILSTISSIQDGYGYQALRLFVLHSCTGNRNDLEGAAELLCKGLNEQQAKLEDKANSWKAALESRITPKSPEIDKP